VRVVDGSAMRAPKSVPKVRHLLNHTSGFGLVAKKEVSSIMPGGDAFLKAPIVFDPGTLHPGN
jgi:CubicO group peptidase (beta-lactamase class C family)